MALPEKNSLPDFLVVDPYNLKASEDSILRKVAKPLEFPLTNEDKYDINTLVLKYDSQEEVGGLAAPQIGISKRTIVFEVPYLFHNVKPLPKTVWINPSYVKVNDEMIEDYESCYSITGMAGLVKRYKAITYVAYTTEGKQLKGRVEGLPARVIQHEVDHLDGKLYVDYVLPGKLVTLEEARVRIAAAQKSQFSYTKIYG